MARIIEASPEELGCINLHGLNPQKLERIRNIYQNGGGGPNHGMGLIDLMFNPQEDTVYLILDGHHKSFVLMENGNLIEAVVWESADEPSSPLVRVNYHRAPGLHSTALLLGFGTLQDLVKQLENHRPPGVGS